jgi:hypothetical protein
MRPRRGVDIERHEVKLSAETKKAILTFFLLFTVPRRQQQQASQGTPPLLWQNLIVGESCIRVLRYTHQVHQIYHSRA